MPMGLVQSEWMVICWLFKEMYGVVMEDWPIGYMHYKPPLRLVRRNGVWRTRKTGNTQGLCLKHSSPR